MEPDPLGAVLGPLLGAIGSLIDPGAGSVEIYKDAPAEHRPLRLAAPDTARDIHPSEIRSAGLTTDYTGGLAIELSFDDAVRDWFATTTRDNVGNTISVLICGAEVTAPVIREPILAGNVLITGNLDAVEWSSLLAVVAGQFDCEGRALAPVKTPGDGPRRSGNRDE